MTRTSATRVYEALGRIGTMKGIICLVDGLSETEELILMAVIGGLEKQINPGMISSLTKLISQRRRPGPQAVQGHHRLQVPPPFSTPCTKTRKRRTP